MTPTYIQSQRIDVLTPSVAMTHITAIVCEMLQENVDYVSKNGMTERAKVSRERLLKLLDITETFNLLASANATLQTECKHLFAQNIALKNQLKQINDETNLANSI